MRQGTRSLKMESMTTDRSGSAAARTGEKKEKEWRKLGEDMWES